MLLARRMLSARGALGPTGGAGIRLPTAPALALGRRSMSLMTDPHAILGVRRGASSQEIKAQYRKMAMQCHPDQSASVDAVAQFRAISEAYSRLSSGSTASSPLSCGDQCGSPSCSNWRPANASDWVWNDRMLPELFAVLVEETGNELLTQLLQRYTTGLLPRKEMLLSIRQFASQDQFRSALRRLAERQSREGGEQRGLATDA